MRQLNKEEFFVQFDTSIHDQIVKSAAAYPDAEAIVRFENQDLSSTNLGAASALVVGPNNTFKSVTDCEGKWLYDLPSQRQYPVNYVLTSDLKGKV